MRSIDDKTDPPTPEQIDELVAFLPKLYADGFKALKEMQVENPDGSLTFPHAVYEDVVHDFVRVASQDQWCDFHYSPATSGDALEDPSFVAAASLEQVKSMLTWCVRGERFCSGHWAEMIDSGKIRLLLERLARIREDIEGS